tara:strand:+ start:1525 stop:3240 length:1716 start_codon:yes stop_codon:yes gene_type:complete
MALTKIDDRGLKTPIELQNDEQIRLGNAGSSLKIYHENSTNHSFIEQASSVNALFLEANYPRFRSRLNHEMMILANLNGPVELYYDNSKKLETVNGGARILGNLQLDADNRKAIFGSSNDLEIYHNGSQSVIDNGTGQLIVQNSGTQIFLQSNSSITLSQVNNGNNKMAQFTYGGSAELYHNNVKKIETTSTGATVTGDLEVTGGITSTSRTNRNLIINGAMQVAQRGTSSTETGYRTVDRFRLAYGNTDENLTQEQVDVASGTTPYTLGFRKAFKITNGNQTGGAGTNDFIIFGHKIEAQDIVNSGWNYKSSSSYVTLSFWIKSSVAQDFKGHLYTPDGTQQIYAFATGSLSANTWTKVTKTISGNSNITIDNDNGDGFHVNIAPFFGTSFTANEVTEDAWATYNSATRMKDNTSTWYTTNDATLEITGMQLEVGDVATDFEHLPYCDVARKCLRYFYKSRADGTLNVGTNLYGSGFFGFGMNGDRIGNGARFPEPMRARPTLTLIRPADGATNAAHIFRGVTGSNGGTDVSGTNISFVDVGVFGFLYLAFSTTIQGAGYLYHIEANAEL